MRKGMSRYEIKQILEEKIESEPDLKYYLDNEYTIKTVSYTHLRAHETGRNLVCRLLLEKKKKKIRTTKKNTKTNKNKNKRPKNI